MSENSVDSSLILQKLKINNTEFAVTGNAVILQLAISLNINSDKLSLRKVFCLQAYENKLRTRFCMKYIAIGKLCFSQAYAFPRSKDTAGLEFVQVSYGHIVILEQYTVLKIFISK